jgi:hypothetical protein
MLDSDALPAVSISFSFAFRPANPKRKIYSAKFRQRNYSELKNFTGSGLHGMIVLKS